jgi:hypothetical protein
MKAIIERPVSKMRRRPMRGQHEPPRQGLAAGRGRHRGPIHSLWAGFLTSAARRGASVFKMPDVSRHKSMDLLQAYVRNADLFRDHAAAGLL